MHQIFSTYRKTLSKHRKIHENPPFKETLFIWIKNSRRLVNNDRTAKLIWKFRSANALLSDKFEFITRREMWKCSGSLPSPLHYSTASCVCAMCDLYICETGKFYSEFSDRVFLTCALTLRLVEAGKDAFKCKYYDKINV